MIKIDVVTPSIAKSSGGVGAAVLDIYNNLSCRYDEISVEIACLKAKGVERAGEKLSKGVVYREFRRERPSKLGFSSQLIRHALRSRSDVVHLHGIWMATTIYGNFSRAFKKKPVVISPHGMLDPWILNQGKFKKRVLEFLYERSSWNNATVIHALNNVEADAIRSVCPSAKVEIIPNGVVVQSRESLKQVGLKDKTRFLYIGRLHRKKNLHSLISAVNSIPDTLFKKNPFVLTIAGWGDIKYEAEILAQIKQGKPDRFEVVGPVFGDEKSNLLSSSDVFILPSFSEGLPIAILEAWSFALPVLMSKYCNIESALSSGIAMDCGIDPKQISASILEYCSLTVEEKNKMSRASYDFVSKNYNWNIIADEYYSMYRSVLRDGR